MQSDRHETESFSALSKPCLQQGKGILSFMSIHQALLPRIRPGVHELQPGFISISLLLELPKSFTVRSKLFGLDCCKTGMPLDVTWLMAGVPSSALASLKFCNPQPLNFVDDFLEQFPKRLGD